MGCDIHAFVEVKVNGVWYQYSNPPIQRWYKLFEKIAGVRGEITNAITPPRGIPSDLSVVTKLIWDEEEINSHHPTWLTAKELDEVIRWTDSQGNEDFNWQYREFGYLECNMFEHRRDVWEDCRFVCWFY